MVSGALDLDIHQTPEHEGQQDDVDNAAVDSDHLEDGRRIHFAAGDAGHHPAVIGDVPAGHHVDEVFFGDNFSECVLDRENDDMHAVDSDGDKPDDPAESHAHLIIKASQDHQDHAECAVKAGGNRLVIFLEACSGEHGKLENITDDEDGPQGHDQIAQPDKSESAVDIAECEKTQECRDNRYRYFFQSFHTFFPLFFLDL